MSGGSAPPGWYHAEGDPPNTERYWDGSEWSEEPRPIGSGMPEVSSTPTASPGGFPTPPVGASAAMFTEPSKATTALVLSIGGLVCCGPAAAIGIWMGRDEQNAIAAGRRDPANGDKAKAAFIIGIIAVGIWVVGIIFYAVIIAAVAS